MLYMSSIAGTNSIISYNKGISLQSLDTARFHLFRSLRVSNAPHHIGKRKEGTMPKNFQAFLAFISYEASDGFCASVRTLFMIGDEKDQDRDTRCLPLFTTSSRYVTTGSVAVFRQSN